MRPLIPTLFATLLFVGNTFAQTAWDGKTIAENYAGGDGTKDNPYLISNGAELAKLAQDVNGEKDFSLGRYFKLTADVVLNENVVVQGTAALDQGSAFPQTPAIGSYTDDATYTAFQGDFDGDGHTISGLYQTFQQVNGNYLALFRVLDGAEIRNLGITDSYVYTGAYLSLLAARVIDSRIINCHVTASILKGWGSNSGPIAGQLLGKSKIQNCYTQCTINGKNDMGAIVGRIGNGGTDEVIVENCYTTSSITLNNRTNKGGVTATCSEGSIVRNCYFTAASAETAVWTAQNKGTEVGCRQMTEEEMQQPSFLDLLNENSRQIPGACRWQSVVGGFPAHDYAEATADVEITRDVNMLATNPSPANGDLHADLDAVTLTPHLSPLTSENATLSWTAARDGKTVSQLLYIGTDSAAIANATPTSATATLGTETSFELLTINYQLSTSKTYYWRVDRIDADGIATPGDVWMFSPRHLAFPGAEGYGRFARGGRGGKVVYVTNLNSEGPGSLRWALTNGQGPRTILFKVSGVIDMEFRQVKSDPLITIAAQTAPGKGICIKHSDIGLGSDVVCRFLRARRGLGTPDDTGNAIGTVYSDHTILDHVTASWGTDETFSSRSSHNITFQRSIISEALGIAGHRKYPEGTNHGYAATIGGDIGSFHHNLLADCNGRNWSMGGGADANGKSQGRLDMFNNVVYNWYGRTTDGGAKEMQFVNNYYKMGPDTKLTCLFSADNESGSDRDQFAYVSGNIRDNRDGSLTTDRLGDTYRATGPQQDKAWVSTPFWQSFATIESAQEAYKSVLSDVGANQPFSDLTDQRIFRETLDRSYTYTGSKSGIRGEIDDEADAGGFEDYPETEWPADFDFDNDGLPTWWEQLRGTNPRSRTLNYADTNRDSEGDGYTELDRYLDFMAQPHLWIATGGEAFIELASLFRGYTKNPSYTIAYRSSGERLRAFQNNGGNVTSSEDTLITVSAAEGVLAIHSTGEKGLTEVLLSVTDADGASYSRRLCIAVTDNAAVTDGIRSVGGSLATERSEAFPTTNALYDLQGRRVGNARKGIYIQNGRKVIR